MKKEKIMFYGKDMTAQEVAQEVMKHNPNRDLGEVSFSSTPPKRDFKGTSVEIHKTKYCRGCGKIVNIGSVCPACGAQN